MITFTFASLLPCFLGWLLLWMSPYFLGGAIGFPVDYLVIAAGGGGGVGQGPGGGGAGGYLDGTLDIPANGEMYIVAVGAGGQAGVSGGGNSSFGGVMAMGGGRGAAYTHNGYNGGSGGGGGFWHYPPKIGGKGVPGQGHKGADGGDSGNRCSGGGGGAGTPGGINPRGNCLLNGGDGKQSNITGSPVWYAGGGGAGPSRNDGSGVAGEGGDTANRGGGGNAGNDGGSGVVIVAYPTKFEPAHVMGNPEVIINGDMRVYRFTSNGNITFLQCDNGTHVETNSSGASSCVECEAGHYQNMTNQPSCVPCPAGEYQDQAGQSSCKACPINSNSLANGQAGCDCDVGYFSASGFANGYVECQPPWSPCPNVDVPQRILYEAIDYDPITGYLTISGVQVGFFKLVRKVVVYAMKKSLNEPDVHLGKFKIKITPGTSKFPLKSPPIENASEVNFVRIKIIGNRVGEGSKTDNGERSHPYWECVEKSY